MRSYFGFWYLNPVRFARSFCDLHAREFLPHPDAVITEWTSWFLFLLWFALLKLISLRSTPNSVSLFVREKGVSVFISFVCIVNCNGWETRFMFVLSAFVLFCRTLILQQYCTSVPAPTGNVGSCLCWVVSFQFSPTFILQRYSTSVPLPTGIVVRRNVTAYAIYAVVSCFLDLDYAILFRFLVLEPTTFCT